MLGAGYALRHGQHIAVTYVLDRLPFYRLFNGGTRLETLFRSILPFLGASVAVLLICTYWAELMLMIPQWFGYVAR
jgi:TRAP-type C4-dicarboxylate transport system permease small subunit